MATLQKALEIATCAHAAQADKFGGAYIFHPLRVMGRVENYGDAAKIVALLHDVVEDSEISLQDLHDAGFSSEIVDAVDAVTKRPDEESADGDYDRFIARAAQNPLAKVVKIADLEDNMDIRRMPDLTEKDFRRLQKYLRAWRFLNGFGRMS